MVENVHVGDTVYFYDGYVEKAEVLAVYHRDKGEYLKLRCSLMQNNTHRWAYEVYFSKIDCTYAVQEYKNQLKQEYMSSINTVEDLVQFLLNKSFNRDSNAEIVRAVAQAKANELLNLNVA